MNKHIKRAPRPSRRQILQALGLGGAALFLRDFLPAFAHRARGAEGDPLYFIHATFDGGWDQLLALDPRDNTVFSDSAGGIYPAYDVLASSDATLRTLLEGNPTGIVRPAGSNLSFGPAVGRLAEGDLWQDLAILRGVDMGTLTHEVGRRYFLTGKFPSGLNASGSSMATELVAQSGDQTIIPNIAVGMETFNEGLDYFASGLKVRSSDDLATVLTPLGVALPSYAGDAIDAYLGQATQRCPEQRLNGDGLVDQYLASRLKALEMTESELGALFAFSANPSDPSLMALNEAFHISSTGNVASAQLAGGAGQAMIAAQALTSGISQAVSIRLATNIDHHDDTYLTDHSVAIREGFEALADLIAYLRSTQHPTSGQSFWAHTLLLVTSDFARTPALNGRDGRDHHLASSCLVAGPGIKGNQVIGATNDTAMGSVPIDLSSGLATAGAGWVMRPPDVHHTLLTAAGLSTEHLSNQEPRLISALLT